MSFTKKTFCHALPYFLYLPLYLLFATLFSSYYVVIMISKLFLNVEFRIFEIILVFFKKKKMNKMKIASLKQNSFEVGFT